MTLPRRQFLHLAACAAALPALAQTAWAQAYPARPVRVIVASAPGGPTDVFARLIAQKLSDHLGKQFYVENVAGASGNIGTGQAARAAPDGHTVLFAYTTFAVNPAFFDKITYDPATDFEPVTLAVASTSALLVNPSVPAKTVKDLVTLVRANPGKYNFGSAGAGTPGHLAGEQFRQATGLDLVHVPFSGAGPAIASTVAGHTPIAFSALAPAETHVKDGRLRALAVLSKIRSRLLPDVPTMAESGYPDMQGDNWIGVVVPARTPKEIVTALNREIAKIIALPDVRTQLATLGFEPVASTPEEFADRIKFELETWRKVIRAGNIKSQ